MKTAYIAKQRQISFVKSHFSRQLEEKLGLIEVQAPILSRVGDGTQDNPGTTRLQRGRRAVHAHEGPSPR